MGKVPAHKPDDPSSDPRTHFSLEEEGGGKAERWIPEPQWLNQSSNLNSGSLRDPVSKK